MHKLTPLLAAGFCLLSAFALPAQNIVISEIDANQPPTGLLGLNNNDNHEFIELFGPAGASLDGLKLVLIDQAEEVSHCIGLDGEALNAQGFYVIGNFSNSDMPPPTETNWIPDAGAVALLDQPACVTNGSDANSIDMGNLVDGFAYSDDPPTGLLGGLLGVLLGTLSDLLFGANPATPAQETADDSDSIQRNFAMGTFENNQAPTPGGFVANGAPLPIALEFFTARAAEGQALLAWRTATELNNGYIAIERSGDGRSFTEIGRLNGAGTTQEPQNYRFTDRQPLPGANYYRLRQADFDGQVAYHGPVGLTFEAQGAPAGITASPTVTQGAAEVRISHSGPGTLYLFNSSGQLLQQWPTAAQPLQVDLSQQPAGVFVLRWQAQQGQAQASARLIKP
ncbi:lamin tail domain-containing protein [Phaeodactylibacter luteus]|uniref:Lamin tail domain-containing protein n=1 Tax=Phaeodactylibacter luteus TaxID=1564516 RepID=A0A5C6RGP5_9BACT|nr:lamin tail domain-containing protein [Phaeodactylibacter luteus]TXB60608.1 lamin tail domain-containing protein [Phaeodactylibacter luteus]